MRIFKLPRTRRHRPLNLRLLLWALAVGGALIFVSCSPSDIEAKPKKLDVTPKERPAYAADIQPILNEYCLRCHQPRDAHGGLRLDSYGALMAGSAHGPVVVPGQPQESLLLRVIKRETPPSQWMPFHQEPLTPNRVRNIEDWISLGAQDN